MCPEGPNGKIMGSIVDGCARIFYHVRSRPRTSRPVWTEVRSVLRTNCWCWFVVNRAVTWLFPLLRVRWLLDIVTSSMTDSYELRTNCTASRPPVLLHRVQRHVKK